MANCVFTHALLLCSAILEPINISSESSNQTDKSEVAQHSSGYYRYRLSQMVFDPDVGMESVDIGLGSEGLVPLNPIDVHPVAHSGSEGSVNQGELSSD